MKLSLSKFINRAVRLLKDEINITENGTYDVSDYANANVDIASGIDTSDATATASDLAKNKTAYSANGFITGSVTEIISGSAGAYAKDEDFSITDKPSFNILEGRLPFRTDVLHRANSSTVFNIAYNKITRAIGLTADKIKKDEKVLGITGTYEGAAPSGGNTPSINAGEYEYVKTFTMDNGKSTDGYLPMVDVYSKGGNLSLLIIRNISSVDTLHVWFEGDEDTDMNIQPQNKSEYLYESYNPADDIDVTHMHNVSSFDWIRPT